MPARRAWPGGGATGSPFPSAGPRAIRGAFVSPGGSGVPRSIPRASSCCSSSTERGIQSLLLNGKALTDVSPEKSYYLIPLAEIEERNVLVLEVETGEAPDDAETDWGHFALVIRPIDRSAGG